MDREKEIEEMAKTLCCLYGTIECDTCAVICGVPENCERLYDAGYRKADEVEKKTVRKILGELWNFWYKTRCQLHYKKCDNRILTAEKAGASNVCDKLLEEIERQRKKYGVEVDE